MSRRPRRRCTKFWRRKCVQSSSCRRRRWRWCTAPGAGTLEAVPKARRPTATAGSLLLKFILHSELEEFSVFPFSQLLLLGNLLFSGLSQLSLALAEQKCQEWKSQYEALKEDWRTLGDRHRELESQLHVLQSKLQVPGPGSGRGSGAEGGRGLLGWTPKAGDIHVTSSFQVFIHCPLSVGLTVLL